MIRRFLLIAFLFIGFSACKKEPFDILPKSCEGISTAINLQKLEELKKRSAGRTDFKVGIIADSHTSPQSLEDEIDRLNNRGDIDIIFMLGDMTDSGQEMEFDWSCKAFQKIKIPFFTVIGNHDSISNGKVIYQKYFGDLNYSFEFMGTKFVFYNDNGFEFPDVPETNFLDSQSKITTGETRYHTIAASHVPPRVDVHTQAEIDAFLKKMNDDGYKLTLHGHLHSFNYDTDNFGNAHFVVSSTRRKQSAVMTVTPSEVKIQECSSNDCFVAEPLPFTP